MKYQEIKGKLCEVARLVDTGDIDKADKIIAFIQDKGLTVNDLVSNLTKQQLCKLRDFNNAKLLSYKRK